MASCPTPRLLYLDFCPDHAWPRATLLGGVHGCPPPAHTPHTHMYTYTPHTCTHHTHVHSTHVHTPCTHTHHARVHATPCTLHTHHEHTRTYHTHTMHTSHTCTHHTHTHTMSHTPHTGCSRSSFLNLPTLYPCSEPVPAAPKARTVFSGLFFSQGSAWAVLNDRLLRSRQEDSVQDGGLFP